jgi:hypothetical protein
MDSVDIARGSSQGVYVKTASSLYAVSASNHVKSGVIRCHLVRNEGCLAFRCK